MREDSLLDIKLIPYFAINQFIEEFNYEVVRKTEKKQMRFNFRFEDFHQNNLLYIQLCRQVNMASEVI